VTFKRGLIGDLRLFEWLKSTRDGTIDRRTVTITLLDETRSPVCQWRLLGAQPRKWTAPALSARGKDVAIEELVLIGEQLEFTSL